MPPSLNIRKAGYLTKKSKRRRGWEKRYFVLTHRSLHRYVRLPTDELFGTLRDTTPLVSIEAVEVCNKSGKPLVGVPSLREPAEASCYFIVRLRSRGDASPPAGTTPRRSDSGDAASGNASPDLGGGSASPPMKQKRTRGRNWASRNLVLLRATSKKDRDEWVAQIAHAIVQSSLSPIERDLDDESRRSGSISGTYGAAAAAAAAASMLHASAASAGALMSTLGGSAQLHLIVADAPPALMRSTLAVADAQRDAAASTGALPLPAALQPPPPGFLSRLFGRRVASAAPSPAATAAAALNKAAAALAEEDPLAPAVRFAGTFEDHIEARRVGSATETDTADQIWDAASGADGVGAEARRALVLFTELGGSVVIAGSGSGGLGGSCGGSPRRRSPSVLTAHDVSSSLRIAVRATDVLLPIVGGKDPAADALAVAALCAAKHAHGAVAPRATEWAALCADADGVDTAADDDSGEASVLPLNLGPLGLWALLPKPAFTWRHQRFGAKRRVIYFCFSASVLAEALKRLVASDDGEDDGDDAELASRCKRCAFVVLPDPLDVAALASILVPVVPRTGTACATILRSGTIVGAASSSSSDANATAGVSWGVPITAPRLHRGALLRIVLSNGAVASFGRAELRQLKAYRSHPTLCSAEDAAAAARAAQRRSSTVAFAPGVGQTTDLPLVGGAGGAAVRLTVLSIDAAPPLASCSSGASAAAKRFATAAAAAADGDGSDASLSSSSGLATWGGLIAVAVLPVPLAIACHWFMLLRQQSDATSGAAASPASAITLSALRVHIAELWWIVTLAMVVQLSFVAFACRRCIAMCCGSGENGCEAICKKKCKVCKKTKKKLKKQRGGGSGGETGGSAGDCCKPKTNAGGAFDAMRDETTAVAGADAAGAESAAAPLSSSDISITFTLQIRKGKAAGADAALGPVEGDVEDEEDDPVEVLVLEACSLTEGYTSSSRLAETVPLASADSNEENVARNVLEKLWDEKTTAEDVPPVGWELLDATLLTQYVRGLRHDDLQQWCVNCYNALKLGLALRGAGEVGEFLLFPPASALRGSDGESQYAYTDLLKVRCPIDEAVHAAFPTSVYGESELGHLVHCERASEFDIDALLKLDTAQTLLVRMQVLETMTELKRQISARRKQRISKHIVVLDLANIPVVKLTFSASARAVMAVTMGLQNHWCVSWLGARCVCVCLCLASRIDLPANAPPPSPFSLRPESAHQIYLVNTPSAFHKAFKMFVEPRMSEATLHKMRVLSSDTDAITAEMVKNGIPLSSIPDWLGGEHPGRPMLDISHEMIAAAAAARGEGGAAASKVSSK